MNTVPELKSRIGQRVRFGLPVDVRTAGGKVIDGTVIGEVWATPEMNASPKRSSTGPDDWGDYSFFAQHIKWDDGSHSIRLGYYRRRAGSDVWRFGSQMTVNSDSAIIKTLLEQTLAQGEWFAELAQAERSKQSEEGSGLNASPKAD